MEQSVRYVFIVCHRYDYIGEYIEKVFEREEDADAWVNAQPNSAIKIIYQMKVE